MSDPISDQTAYLLTKNPNIFTPLEQLYRTLSSQGLMAWLELEDYWLLLESDARFEVLAGLREILTWDTLDSHAGLGLEVLDFFTGPWVLLRARNYSTTEVLQELLLYLHQMNETLEVTWQYIPDDPDNKFARNNLLNMLMWGDLLEHQIRETLIKPGKAEPEN